MGPVAIHKDYQKRGLGSRLIEYTLGFAESKGIPFVFVIGDESYYQRFGFVSASGYDIFFDGTDTSQNCPFFMIKVFDERKILNKRAIFHNPQVFDVNADDVDEFDQNFEYRQKLVLKGQLE